MRGYKNFDGSPHPGNLRHRIEIGYTQSTVNENGYPDAEDIVLCRVWADATDAGNQHYRSADVMNTEAVINFTIRYRADVVPGMWVRFRGKKWFISTLGEYGFRRDYLGLKASPTMRPSGDACRRTRRRATGCLTAPPRSGQRSRSSMRKRRVSGKPAWTTSSVTK